MSSNGRTARTSLVVGFDGSQTSVDALHWALDAARLRGCDLQVVYAVAPTNEIGPQFGGYATPDLGIIERAAVEVLAGATAEAHRYAPDIRIHTRVIDAAPVAALLTDSATHEMVVVGSHGRAGFAELLVGATGVELSSHSRCPVVVVRPRTGAPGPQAGRIVVGVDGSDLSIDAVGFAFEEASLRGIGVTAIHAWDKPPYDLPPGTAGALPGYVIADEFTGAEMHLLAESIAAWTSKYPGVDLRSTVVHTDPVSALVSASAGAELLVVGSRGHGGFTSLLLGSVSHAALHHAHCPVVVVRHRTS